MNTYQFYSLHYARFNSISMAQGNELGTVDAILFSWQLFNYWQVQDGMRVASVTDFITVDDIDLVFDHLERKYSFAPAWRAACREYIVAQAVQSPLPQKDPVLAFLAFGSEQINPLLNAARCNPVGYAYFSRMVFWLLRDRLTDQSWIKFDEKEPY